LILASIVIRSHFLVTLQCEGIMVRATVIFSAVLAVILFAVPANGQQLVNKGILVTQILARTRMGICEKGDLVHVTVRQPAGSKGYTVSVHAEYTDASGKWAQVPPPKGPIGPWYTSNFYGGMRDYVEVPASAEAKDQNIALFMPFNGFSLNPGKDYQFRYVVRLWIQEVKDGLDKEIGSLKLDPYRVHIGQEKDGILVTIVNEKPCGFLTGAAPKKDGEAAGLVRFFDTTSGKWDCPDSKESGNRTAARR